MRMSRLLCFSDEMNSKTLASILTFIWHCNDRLEWICNDILLYCGPKYWCPDKLVTSFCSFPFIDRFNPNNEISILTWSIVNHSGYHYLVSRGEWTETYSIGILKTSDKRGVARAWLGKILHTKDPVPRGKVVYLALTYDGNTVKFFMNGKLHAKAKVSAYRPYKTSLWLGGEALGLGSKYKYLRERHFIDGKLWVEIYGKCLHPEDIANKTCDKIQ